MQVPKDVILDEFYKLRIATKRLSSGRYQVKFFAVIHNEKEVYGYLLADSGETLKSVTSRIKRRLSSLQSEGDRGYFQLTANLEDISNNQLMIFQS